MSELRIQRESLPGGGAPPSGSSGGKAGGDSGGDSGGASGGARVLLRLVGDADVDHAVELAGALDALSKERPRLVILDCAALAFISSMGIGSLFTFAHALAKAGGEARLAAARPEVERALRACRAEQIMKMFPTVAAASA